MIRKNQRPKALEDKVHKLVVDYLKLRYPQVIFRTDGAGLRLPIGLAMKFKNLQCCRAYPDLFIAEPKGKFAGLYIEIKKDRDEYLRQDGTIRQDKHIQEQLDVMTKLQAKGYLCNFGGGFRECREIIDEYLAINN